MWGYRDGRKKIYLGYTQQQAIKVAPQGVKIVPLPDPHLNGLNRLLKAAKSQQQLTNGGVK